MTSPINLYIQFFSDSNKNSVSEVGGKGASLGEMTQAGIPVPLGFVVTTETFKQFSSQELPIDVKEQILQAFDDLGADLVAVRSSAVAEDSGTASWAGQLESYLNTSRDTVIDRIRDCWNSIKNERALAYAAQNDIPEEELAVAVVIQKMVNSEASGVMFTVNPITNNYEEIMIEACYGLGEMLVQGMVTPDNYLINKNSGEIKEKSLNTQTLKLIFQDGQNTEVSTTDQEQGHQILTEEQIQLLVDLGKKIENHYGKPQDIEWAIEDNQIYIVQSRPITTLDKDTSGRKNDQIISSNNQILIEGVGAVNGLVTGKVRLIHELTDLKNVIEGEILVAPKTSPDFMEAFSKISAVVTDSGGITSHAAIVARELKIPAVVGTQNATKTLKEGTIITVDGYNGKIYAGQVETVAKIEKDIVRFKETDDVIEDFLNAISLGLNDVSEFWPLYPTQLFGYIDVDQAVDMFNKLKKLQNEKNLNIEDLASLFERPHLVRSFLLNSGVIGLKVACKFNIAPISKQDQRDFLELFHTILQKLTQKDPFCLQGNNLLLNEKQLEIITNDHAWFPLDNNLNKAINTLSAALFALNWAFYWDYFDSAGTELHGPYNVANLGSNQMLIVRDYFEGPEEIWPLAKEISYKSIQLSQSYDQTDIFINFANRIIKQPADFDANKFSLIVDGKEITEIEEIIKLSERIMVVTKKQTDFVNSLSDMEKVRKGAMLAYYSHKKFYSEFDKEWYPKDRIEKLIAESGNKWIEEGKNPINLDLETKRKIFDPRDDFLPS